VTELQKQTIRNEEIHINGSYYGHHAPRESEGLWVFQEAYCDAPVCPHVLTSSLWQELGGWCDYDGCALHKCYKKRSDAFRALERAQVSLARKTKLKKIWAVLNESDVR
jgi:hypothetical protein